MLQHDLTIWRGATWHARGWVLRGATRTDGSPGPVLRSLDGLDDVRAKVRRHDGDPRPLLTFNAKLVMMHLPGLYDDDPVAVAQLAEIPHTETAALGWDRGVWHLQVNHDTPIVGGDVTAPLVRSR